MPYFIKIINVFLLATVKFFYAPLYAFLIGLNFFEALLSVLAGGLFGFFVFYYLSNIIILLARFLKPIVIKHTPQKLSLRIDKWKSSREKNRKKRKKFSKRNKLIINARSYYGMWGICLLTPILLSIPIGAFLLRKYYYNRKQAISAMMFSLIVEGIIISVIFWFIVSIKPG